MNNTENTLASSEADQNNTKTQVTRAELVKQSLKKRYRAEMRFRAYGITSIAIGMIALIGLFIEVIGNGIGVFQQTHINLSVNFDADVLGISDATDEEQIRIANYTGIIRESLSEYFPDVTKRREKRDLFAFVSVGAGFDLQRMLREDPTLLGKKIKVALGLVPNQNDDFRFIIISLKSFLN